MRKVTEQIVAAFLAGRTKTVGNSHTDGSVLLLHGNAIAKRENGKLYIRTAGWATVTTRERLNGLPGVSVSQMHRRQYLNGKVWEDHEEWTEVNQSK